MATLEQTISQLEVFIDALNNEMPDVILETAISGKSLIQNRIQERGLNADENQLGVYSAMSKAIRSEKGYQTSYVDLTFSGRMWANIGVKQQKKSSNQFIVTIGPKNEDSTKKLSDNTERFGEIMQLSKAEKEEVELIAEYKIDQLAKKYLK